MVRKEWCARSPCATHEGQPSETLSALSWELDDRITLSVVQGFRPLSVRKLQRCNFIHPEAAACDHFSQHPFPRSWAELYLFPSEPCPCTSDLYSRRWLCKVSSPSLLQGLKPVSPVPRWITTLVAFGCSAWGSPSWSCPSDTRNWECKWPNQRGGAHKQSWF